MGQLSSRCGPRRLDAHHASKISVRTLARYRSAAKKFTAWLDASGLNPRTPDEWDDLLVEYRAACLPTRSQFTETLCAVMFFFPVMKDQLPWTHAVIEGWQFASAVKHVVPMSWGFTVLIATKFVSLGYPRLAVGMIVQQKSGLRPTEMLTLHADDVLLPTLLTARPVTMLRLGHRTRGTKAKREQYSLLFHDLEPLVVDLLHRVKSATPPGQRLFPFTIELYRRLLLKVEGELGTSIGFSPHSPRAGYASDGVAAGRPWSDIKEGGRWVSDSSFRVYLDLVGTASIALSAERKGLLPLQAAALATLSEHFPRGTFGEADANRLLENRVSGVVHGAAASQPVAGPQGHSRGTPPFRGRGRGSRARGGRF